MDNYTVAVLEAACCAWEAMLSVVETTKTNDETPLGKAMQTLFSDAGCGQARLCAVYLAPSIHEGWEAIPEDMRDHTVFDWEFVPWFTAECCDWTGEGARIYADAARILVPTGRYVDDEPDPDLLREDRDERARLAREDEA
jgi:hypothetical protein